jgi:catechol 2,3-dioxygenase-like lactoylglutathione lyase family enzyme
MLLSLGHVTVLSTDLPRTEHFYCNLLGLRVGPRPAIRIPGCWLYLGDQAVLHVLARQAAPWPSHAQHVIDHFALDARDRGAFEQRLRAAGQPFESRRLADSGIWQIFLNDPDGARVELSFAPVPDQETA